MDCLDSTSRRAIARRMAVIFTRLPAAGASLGVVPSLAAAASTSSLEIRPFGPVPTIVVRSMPSFSARRYAIGLTSASPSPARAGSAGALAGAAGGGASPPGSNEASAGRKAAMKASMAASSTAGSA